MSFSVSMNPPVSSHAAADVPSTENGQESLFERFGWFYAFLRVRVFRDDTETIARILQLALKPKSSSHVPVLVELGCGPGFYACHLAARFPGWNVVGVDRSQEQLRRASQAAHRLGLHNCSFERNDASALNRPDASVDGVFASRLFTVIETDKLTGVLSEMHRVLRPDGRCLIAEPRSRWRAAIPLKLLWLLARLSSGWTRRHVAFSEPQKPTVLAAEDFKTVVASQPWAELLCWEDGHYQYALVRKRIVINPALPDERSR